MKLIDNLSMRIYLFSLSLFLTIGAFLTGASLAKAEITTSDPFCTNIGTASSTFTAYATTTNADIYFVATKSDNASYTTTGITIDGTNMNKYQTGIYPLYGATSYGLWNLFYATSVPDGLHTVVITQSGSADMAVNAISVQNSNTDIPVFKLETYQKGSTTYQYLDAINTIQDGKFISFNTIDTSSTPPTYTNFTRSCYDVNTGESPSIYESTSTLPAAYELRESQTWLSSSMRSSLDLYLVPEEWSTTGGGETVYVTTTEPCTSTSTIQLLGEISDANNITATGTAVGVFGLFAYLGFKLSRKNKNPYINNLSL